MPAAPFPGLAPVYTVEALRAVEARHAGAGLMECAGEAAATVARDLLAGGSGTVVVLAGPGNNGGDGFVVARRLREAFHDVAVVFRDDTARLPRDAAAAYAAFVASGGTTVPSPPRRPPGLIVDALFGIGLRRALAPAHAELVTWANDRRIPVLALDIPTGLDADTGLATPPAIRATATATFIALKPGLLTAAGPDHCGALSVHALGLDPEAEGRAAGHALAWPPLAAALPAVLARRQRGVHKGTFGTLAIVGGAPGMAGALILAGRSAARAGAGKVWLGFAAPDRPAYDPLAPELMLRSAAEVLAGGPDAIVVGCGLGTSDAARALLRQAMAVERPLVLDADALNLLAADSALRGAVQARAAATLATPHPAEAARLLGCDLGQVEADRLAAACAIGRELRAHVVLKGAGSVLAHPDATWDINRSGNPALASAGTGDVLAGLAGAFLAQDVDPKSALRLAVCLHGAAADALVAGGVGPLGTGASELPDAARALLNAAGRSASATN